MPARIGAEYIANMKENGPEVYLHGERVKDVTTHPALRGGVETLARMYDMQHDPAIRDEMTYVFPHHRQPRRHLLHHPRERRRTSTPAAS